MPDPELKDCKPTLKKKQKAKTSKINKNTSKVSRTKKKQSPDDGIAKSKQLVQRLQTSKSHSSSRSKSGTSNNNEVRLCGNGKPMPSLLELEKMYADSDSDEESKKSKTDPEPTSSSTPKQISKLPVEKLISPKTIINIADRMLDLVSNLTELPILLDDDGPPPTVIKPKKRKKSGIPYIVGCKDRDYVPEKPNNHFCKGDDKYGIEEEGSDDDESDCPKKRAKRTKRVNLSKSIFNAASDEIAARLKDCDAQHSDASSDSNKTVAYEYYTPYTTNRVKSFSPLPSTSKDNETFVKNDKMFDESLISENTMSSPKDNDIEIIETPCETITIDDTMPFKKLSRIEDTPIIELIDDSTLDNPDNKSNIESINKTCDDDSIQLVEVQPVSPIPVDDLYTSYCNLSTEQSYTDDVCEYIDVDNLIAENAAIIRKYSKKDDLNTITSVDLSNTVISVADVSEISCNVNEPTSAIENVPKPQAQSNTAPQSRSEEIECVEVSNLTNQADDVIKILENNLHRLQSILNVIPNNSNVLENTINNLQNIHNKHKKSRAVSRNSTPISSGSNPVHPLSNTDTTNTSSTSIDSPQGGTKRLGDCPICMDTLANKTVASTLCGHIFCMNCIKQSIKSNGRKCPTCRKALRGAGFHQIFL